MGGVLAAAGCSRRAGTPSKYVFTPYGILIWSQSGPADYANKGSPKPGDPVPQSELIEHVKQGRTEEYLLSNGYMEPGGVTDRASKPHSGLVYTASFVECWAKSDPHSYAEFGSPAGGDPATVSEAMVHCAYMGMKPRETLVTRGMMAPPEAPYAMSVYRVKGDLDEWCALSKEDPQEPLYPILDPHHHLWERERQDGEPMLCAEAHTFGTRQGGHAYPHERLQRDAAGNAVVGTIHLECGANYHSSWPMADQERSASESKWIQDIADQSPVPLAIVAHLDLYQGRESVERGLAVHKHVANNLVGVRHSLAWHEGPPLNSRANEGQIKEVSRNDHFRASMEVLAELGLTFDTWLYHTNLPELIDLAKACPRTQIICDHVGQPVGTALSGLSLENATKEWRAHIAELAKCENVVVKLSGLSMPCVGFAFDLREKPPTSAEMAEAYKPYFAHCLECFGPTRCMFASNFPVDKVSGSYTTHWNAFKLLAQELLPGDEAAQRALFYDNAVRVYHLDKPPFSMPSTSKEAEGLPKY